MGSKWPSSWRRSRLGDVADLNWGDTSVTKSSYVNTGFKAYSASGPDGFLPYADYDRTGVVVSAIGAECGRTWLARGKWSCIKNTLRFWATSSDVDTEFLYWLTLSHIIWPKRGSAQPFISQGDARAVEVAYPPLSEQRAIARILSGFDDKIELNRRMNETLETMARALFKSWFIDFDPVHAKAEGRDPGLPADIVALFPDSFQNSDLGEIPEGWRIGTLEDYAELNSESWSADTVPDEVNYVDLANTKWGRIEVTQRLSWKEAPSRARRVLRLGDTIVGTVRPGNGSFALIAEDGLTGSTGFAVLRPRTAAYAELVYLAVTEHENIVRLAHLADGAAYPAVKPEVVLQTGVARPGRLIVECFARCTRYLMERQAANDAESRTLAALRDKLLPKLLSGELKLGIAGPPMGDTTPAIPVLRVTDSGLGSTVSRCSPKMKEGSL